MKITLTEKLVVTDTFLADLIDKSWQEIEHLQTQIANIEATEASVEVVRLLKQLLTNYYVFVGGLENINNSNSTTVAKIVDTTSTKSLPTPVTIETEPEVSFDDQPMTTPEYTQMDSEPFEYFVDFDEPTGEPLTDEDLYN
jgi:hypothetical protein